METVARGLVAEKRGEARGTGTSPGLPSPSRIPSGLGVRRARGLRTRCEHRGEWPLIDPRMAQRPRVRSLGRAPGRGEGGGPGKTPERGGRRRGGGQRPREVALRVERAES